MKCHHLVIRVKRRVSRLSPLRGLNFKGSACGASGGQGNWSECAVNLRAVYACNTTAVYAIIMRAVYAFNSRAVYALHTRAVYAAPHVSSVIGVGMLSV